MANMALASLRSERQARISRLAEADFDDEVLIAEARKRTKLRDVERGLLEEGLSVPYEDGSAQRNEQVAGESVVQQDVKQEQDLAPDPTAIDDQPDFGSLLENFRDACDHLAPEDALDCSGCGGYPPDDPIMTSCLCVYCTECFTELLAKTDRDGGSSTIPCPAYPDEEIEYYKTLTPGEFEALLSIFAHHTRTDETFKMPFTAKVQEIPDDVEVLWRSRGAGKVSAHRCGDHSRTSPELGDDSMELSSDGFDGASRSTGYENDSSSETASQLGLISASIGLVDPRHDANEDDVPFSDEENLPCLRVSSDEMGELGINMNGWDGSPQDATTPAHIVSTHAPHIDLTRSDDAQQGAASHSEVASEKSRDSDDESEEEGVEDDDEGDADEGDLCECYDCMGTF